MGGGGLAFSWKRKYYIVLFSGAINMKGSWLKAEVLLEVHDQFSYV